MQISSNAFAYKPEPEPERVKPSDLRARGWPESLVQRVESSLDLQKGKRQDSSAA